MAVTKDDLLIKIQADTKSASVSIDRLSGDFKEFSDSVEQANKQTTKAADMFSGLGGRAILFNQSIEAATQIYQKFLRPLVGSIGAYKEAEDAINKMAATLTMLGDTAGTETAQNFAKLSDAIEKQIGIQAELVLQMQTSAKAAGLTNNQVVKITKTAADFASGAGISFNQAFLGLQKSLKGTGLELATYMPALAKMTREQFIAGEGIDAISEKYQGFANIVAGTFQMSINRAEIAIGDLQKSFGRILVDLLPIDSGFKGVIETMNAFVVFFDRLPTDLGGFTKAYQIVKSVIGLIIQAVDVGMETLSRIIITFVEGSMVAFNGFVTGILYAWRELQSILATTGLIDQSSVDKTTAMIDSFAEKTKQSIGGVTTAIRRMNEYWAKTDIPEAPEAVKAITAPSSANGTMQIVDEQAQKEIDALRSKTIALQQSVLSFNKTQREQIKSKVDGEIKILEIQKQQFEQQQKMIQAAEVQKQIDLKRQEGAKQVEAAPASAYESIMQAGQRAAGEISGVFSEGLMGSVAGAVGAANMIADAIQGLINAGPDLLNKIAGIFNSLAELPTKLLEGLMNIDTALQNFIDNFPQAFTRLMARLPELIASILEKLGQAGPAITRALLMAVPPFVKALVKQAPKIAIAMAKGFVEAIGSLLGDIFKGKLFVETPEIDAAPITDGIKQTIQAVTSEASKTFAVLDLKQAAKRGRSVTQDIDDSINMALKKQEAWWVGLWQDLQNFFGGAYSLLEKIGELFMPKNILAGIESAGKYVSGLINNLINALKNLLSSIGPMIANIWVGLKKAVESLGNIFANFGKEIWAGFKKAIEESGSIFSEIGKKIGNGLKEIFEIILGPINDLISALKGGKAKKEGEKFADNVVKALKDPKKIFGLANGGPVYAAAGMMMPSFGTDTVPAMLTPGEYVINRAAVNRFGQGFMDQINRGVMPQQASAGQTTVNVAVNITSNGQLDENFIRSRLMPTIKNEFRRASLDGQFVISAKGVR